MGTPEVSDSDVEVSGSDVALPDLSFSDPAEAAVAFTAAAADADATVRRATTRTRAIASILAVDALPLDQPAKSITTDVTVTLLLGAGAYFGSRRVLRRLFAGNTRPSP